MYNDDEMMYQNPDDLIMAALGTPPELRPGAPAPPVQQGPVVNSTQTMSQLRQPGRIQPMNAQAAGAATPDVPPPDAHFGTTAMPVQQTNIPPDPRRAAAQAGIDANSQPTDRSKTKPSWQRILLGLLVAGAGGANDPRHAAEFGGETGDKIWNGKYYQSEQDRGKRLKGFETQLDAVNNDDKVRHEQRLENQSQYRMDLEDKRLTQMDADRDEDRRLRQDEVTRSISHVGTDGKIHAYDVTRSGKEIDRGIAPKDETLGETKRHNQAMESIDRDRLNKEGGGKGGKKLGTPAQFADVEERKKDDLTKLGNEILNRKADLAILPDSDPRKQNMMQQIDDYRISEEKRIERSYGEEINSLGGTYQGAPVGGNSGYNWTDTARSQIGAGSSKQSKTAINSEPAPTGGKGAAPDPDGNTARREGTGTYRFR
jgi:hypothetical protein